MTDRGPGSRKQRATAQRGTKLPKQAQDRPRRISRREREAKRQRRIRLGVGLAAAAVLAVLLGFGTYEYIVKPRQVLATVDGARIRRDDYWRYRSLELYNQVAQYSQFAQFVNDPSQQQQYQSMALQAQNELNGVWGSTSVNDSTLQRMIDDQVYLSSLDEFGLTVTNDDADLWAQNQFAPADAPLIPPTVTPTFVPERAEWETATAQALLPSPTATPPATPSSEGAVATPVFEASPQVASGSPVASPIIDAATPIAATPIASPVVDGAVGSPVGSPEVSPTMEPALAQQTAEAGFKSYQDAVLDTVHMSHDDYIRLYARPQVARQEIRDVLTADIGQTADQVHAEHILVATEELANQIYADVTSGGQNFESVAKEKSTDTSTAPNGGDLGWFPKGVMVAPFEDAAFSTAPGEIHPPVQSEFGWHIIKVIEVQPNRALTDDQISQLQDSTVNKWLEGRSQQLSISSVMEPTPTPVAETFVPPVDAPQPPVATEPVIEASPAASPAVTVPETGTPGASPVASPVLIEPAASPVVEEPLASPVTSAGAGETPVATPAAATPLASPEASPLASPMASPESSPIVNPLGTPAGD